MTSDFLTVDHVLIAILCIVFVRAGWLNLSAPSFIRVEFAGYGYSDRLRIAVGVIEWVAAGALLYSGTRLLGCVLAMLVLLGVLATFCRHREFGRLEYPLVLLALSSLLSARLLGLL